MQEQKGMRCMSTSATLLDKLCSLSVSDALPLAKCNSDVVPISGPVTPPASPGKQKVAAAQKNAPETPVKTGSHSQQTPPSGASAKTSSTQVLALSPTIPPRMQRQEWCLDQYTITEKLYTGYASTVFKALCKITGDVVVLKIYHLSSVCELYRYQIYREVRVHRNLQHENVVHLIAAFQEGDQVVMVQEYADGSDLFTLLHKYGGRMCERLAVQLVMDPFLRVLQYLHSRGIIHRDIKPENILFTRAMCLKLGDFGLAIDLREERAVTRAGTLDYMAPEVLRCPFKSKPEENKDNERLHYNNTVDSWAVGVLTYELLVGFPPFFDQSRSGTEDRIMTSIPSFPAGMSDEARDFICAALQKNACDRPTVLDMLHHPWIESHRARRSMRYIPPTSPRANSHTSTGTTPSSPNTTNSGVTSATATTALPTSPQAPPTPSHSLPPTSTANSFNPATIAAATKAATAAVARALGPAPSSPALPTPTPCLLSRHLSSVPSSLSSIIHGLNEDLRGSAKLGVTPVAGSPASPPSPITRDSSEDAAVCVQASITPGQGWAPQTIKPPSSQIMARCSPDVSMPIA